MKDNRPNILVVLTDQQRLDAIQALGNSFDIKTPNIDTFVREGMAFTNCHCTAPICSPSRSTLMTGLTPTQAGMPGNLYAPCPPMSPRQDSIGKLMRAGGYETAYHGKWHLGGDLKEYGFDNGEECSHDESTRLMAARYWRDRDWVAHERPFFHIVSFLDPHDLYFYDPAKKEPGFKRKWKNLDRPEDSYPEAVRGKRVDWDEERWGAYHKFYSERIEKVDRDIGLLMDDLRCSGFYPNTWIIFASDHGDMAGEQNIPFKGSFMYDGVTRVPLVVVPPRTRYSGDFSRGVNVVDSQLGNNNGLCSLLDVVPTVLDLAGVKQPEGLMGKSLMPHVQGKQTGPVHDAVFAEWHAPHVRMCRTTDWKYVRYSDGFEELFNLKDDPAEAINLATDASAADNKAELRARLDANMKATNDPWDELDKHAFIYTPQQALTTKQ